MRVPVAGNVRRWRSAAGARSPAGMDGKEGYKAWDRGGLRLAARNTTIYRQAKLLALKLCPSLQLCQAKCAYLFCIHGRVNEGNHGAKQPVSGPFDWAYPSPCTVAKATV